MSPAAAGVVRNGVLLLADAAAFAVAGLATHALVGRAGDLSADSRLFALIALSVIALRALAGLYPGHGLHPPELLRRGLTANAVAGGMVCIVAVVLFADLSVALSAGLCLLLGTLLQPVLRARAQRLLHGRGLWTVPAEIIAHPELLPAVTAYFEHRWHYGVNPTPGRGPRAALAVIADRTAPSFEELRRLQISHREVIVLADLPTLALSGLRSRDLQGSIGLRLRGAGHRSGGDALKRLFDLAVAVPLAVMLSPLMLAAAAAIYAIDPGPVLYRQMREGLGGRPLPVLKLRTMYQDAEALLQKVLDADPEAQRQWSEHFKLKHDPRVLPFVGRFLRASSLDELPQLVNVIQGGMSLVGPRPFPDYHLDAMQPAFRRKRCSVTPGITGLWQISNRSDADVPLQQQLDDFHIENQSFWLDLSILVETVPAVVLHRGAY